MNAFILTQLISLYVNLAWDRSPDSSVTGYRVYQKQLPTGPQVSYVAGNVLQIQITGLTKATTYEFYATAYNQEGVESVPSNKITYQTQAVRPTSLTLSSRGILTLNVYRAGKFSIERTSDLNKPFNLWKTFTAGDDVELFGVCMDDGQAFFRLRDRTEEIIPLKTKEQVLTEALRSAIAKENMQNLIPKISSTELKAPLLTVSNSTSVGAAVMRKKYKSADMKKGATRLLEMLKR